MQLGTADDPYVFDITGGGYRVPNFPQPTVVVAALDSRTGKVVWKKELPSYDDSGLKSNGGALSTAGGLVFHQGGDGTLQAYSATTGETLWRFQTDFAVGDGSPMSYAVDGKQYVAFIAGSKVWAFTLGGKLPQAAPIALRREKPSKARSRTRTKSRPSHLSKFPGTAAVTASMSTLSIPTELGFAQVPR